MFTSPFTLSTTCLSVSLLFSIELYLSSTSLSLSAISCRYSFLLTRLSCDEMRIGIVLIDMALEKTVAKLNFSSSDISVDDLYIGIFMKDVAYTVDPDLMTIDLPFAET